MLYYDESISRCALERVLRVATYRLDRPLFSLIFIVISLASQMLACKDDFLTARWNASFLLDLGSELPDGSCRLDLVGVGTATEVLAEELHREYWCTEIGSGVVEIEKKRKRGCYEDADETDVLDQNEG